MQRPLDSQVDFRVSRPIFTVPLKVLDLKFRALTVCPSGNGCTTRGKRDSETMERDQPAIRQPNGDLLIPAQTAQLLERALERLQEELSRAQGQECITPGRLENAGETANRQDYVDRLSASANVNGPTVHAQQMPATSAPTDNSSSIELLQALSQLLFRAS